MKKHQKKRIGAFIVGLVLSIMITPFCFYKLSESVQAAGNVITYNSYGSTERGVVNVAYNGTTYMTDSFIRFNFNGNYNGILGINLSGASPLSNLAVVPDNCHIISTSTNYIQIEFYGVNQCEVHFTGWQALVGSFDIQSVIWNSMTKVSDSDSAQLVNIVNRLTTLNGYNDQIESLLTTNNQLLNTIAANGGSGGTSYVNEINVNVDHIADDLNLLKASNDSILDELLGFFSDGLGHVLTIDNVVNAIKDTTTALLGIQSQLTSIGTTLNSINTTLNNINSSINSLDTQLDTISWINYTTPTSLSYKYRSEDSWNSYTSGDLSFTSTGDIFLQIPSQAYRYPRLYKLTIPFYYYNNANNGGYNLSVVENVASTNSNIVQFYKTSSQGQITIYFISYSSVNSSSIYLKFHSDVKKGSLSSRGSFSLQYIDDNDIEYWQLLDIMNNYSMQQQILTALENLSINVHGDIVQQTETVINNYDTNFNTIHNIENNFTNNFDSVNPGVLDLFNTNLQIPQGFVEGSNFIKVLFPKVIDNSSLVGFPYFLILAIVVLIVLLG